MAARSVVGAPVAQAPGPPTRHPSARRIVLIVEQGRLGFFVTHRGGIDAGHMGFHRVQYTRRISVQRGHSQAALTGRTDELATQPFDKLLPGFYVHHFQFRAVGRVSWRNGGYRRASARPIGIISPQQMDQGTNSSVPGAHVKCQGRQRGTKLFLSFVMWGSIPGSYVWFANRLVSAVGAPSHVRLRPTVAIVQTTRGMTPCLPR